MRGGRVAAWAGENARAQSTTVGFALVIALTVIGAGLIVGFGAQALDDTQESAALDRGEHAMTRLDAGIAVVGLGETSSRSVNLGPSGAGQYAAEPDAGRIVVEHVNYTSDKTETIYDASLGEIYYENGGTTIAYQAGGVWRHQDNGTVMLSPPEFHYRDGTLTLPVLRVVSGGGAGGPTSAFVERVRSAHKIYPNRTTLEANGVGAPYNDTFAQYENPIRNGTVVVTVHSQYYKGWAEYFRERTEGNVTLDHENESVSLELATIGDVGQFEMTDALDEDGVGVNGMVERHGVSAFNVTFEKGEGGTFSNKYFTFHTSSGKHRLEMVVYVPSGTSCNSGVDSTDDLEVYVFYRDTNSGEQHEWLNTDVTADSGDIRLECDDKDASLIANYSGSTPLTYGNTSVQTSGTFYDWSTGESTGSVTFSHAGYDDEPFTVTDGTTNTTNVLTRHYFAVLAPDFNLYAETGTGGGGDPQLDQDASGGTFAYESGSEGTFITYLHITENEVRIEFE